MKKDGINALLSLAILIVIWKYYQWKSNGSADIPLQDFTFFFCIVAAMILQTISSIISKYIMNGIEDSIKLDTNYAKLASRYPNGLIEYNNAFADAKNISKLKKADKSLDILTATLPVVKECILHNSTMHINDEDTLYMLPDEIKAQYCNLFGIHKGSNIYNQLNIRVNSWEIKDNEFYIHTMRTTYFDSLVTNRAMDFIWDNGLSIRDKYQYGPFVPSLLDSPLSNHLGFNGFIVSSDGYIPIVKRNRNVSIGKSTYGNSIGASLKAKYSLLDDSKLTVEGLRNGIIQEIHDELKIDLSYLESFDTSKHIIAAYRDMVEGGKPQLLFYYPVNMTFTEIKENFKKKLEKKKQETKSNKWNKELKELEDGSKLKWIKEKKLYSIAISSDRIIYEGKSYQMMPSASASFAMLIEWMETR